MELVIKNLHAKVEDKEILKGVNLVINTGEIHAIMGPNGTGKSTLSAVIMGHPKYVVTEGTIELNGENILEMSVDERSRKGIFLAMQYPNEIPGITNSDFIKSAMQARLNEGFSGGEKKRNEILQMKMLKPNFAILDEIDSGLDVDALRIVGENVNNMRSDEFGALVITHYQRLLDYIDVDYVHIMMNGKIVRTGGKELIAKIDASGYDWLKEELGIEDEVEVDTRQHVVLGSCAVKKQTENK